jgi:hypothetical protein
MICKLEPGGGEQRMGVRPGDAVCCGRWWLWWLWCSESNFTRLTVAVCFHHSTLSLRHSPLHSDTALRTLNPALWTLNPALWTLHSGPCTLNPAL